MYGQTFQQGFGTGFGTGIGTSSGQGYSQQGQQLGQFTQSTFGQQPYIQQIPYTQQIPYAQQSFAGQQGGFQGIGQGIGYATSAYPVSGIMNSAAQTLQSNFPMLHTQVMRDYTQTTPYQPSYGSQAQTAFYTPMMSAYSPSQTSYYTPSQYSYATPYLTQTQAQYPQSGWQASNILHNFQQSNPSQGSFQQSGIQGGFGSQGYSSALGSTGFGTGTMGTTISPSPAFSGGIMSSAANDLQSNINTLQSNTLKDWSQTTSQNYR